MRLGLAILPILLLAAPAGQSDPGQWPPASSVISRTEMCRPEKLGTISPVKVDGIHWGGAVYPAETGTRKPAELADRIEMVHEAGAKFIGSINGRGFLHKGMESEAVFTLDGKPLLYPPMNNAVFKCSLNPKMFDAFVSTALRCVDMEMDGFILDSWSAEGGTLCFCGHCSRFYQDCLRRHRKDPRLKELAKVSPWRFDYAKHLRKEGATADTKPWNLPLGPVFSEFRERELIERKKLFWKTVRAYAQKRGGRPFRLTANVYSMPWRTFAVHELLDYLTVELPFFAAFNGYPPDGTSIALHKKARMCGRRAVCQPGCHDTARALIGKESTATLFKIWIAEAYASGNIFELLSREFAGYEKGKVVFLEMPAAELAPYCAFVQAHPEIYCETTSPAKVGVLYGMRSARLSPQTFEREFQATCKVLHDAHIQFDAVLVGDGDYNETLPTAKELGKYRALIAVNPQLYREETVAQLLSYRKSGGKVLLCGTYSRAEPPYATLCKEVLGEVVAPEKLRSFLPYLKKRESSVRDAVRSEIGPDDVLSAEAPPDVGIIACRAGKRTILHLINYGYDREKDAIRPARDIRITIPRTEGEATFFSPDAEGETVLPLTTRETTMFVVPGLDIYGVIVIGPGE